MERRERGRERKRSGHERTNARRERGLEIIQRLSDDLVPKVEPGTRGWREETVTGTGSEGGNGQEDRSEGGGGNGKEKKEEGAGER